MLEYVGNMEGNVISPGNINHMFVCIYVYDKLINEPICSVFGSVWAIFTVYQKEISFFFYFSHRILPFGWFSMKNKSSNTFSDTSSLVHLYHTWCSCHKSMEVLFPFTLSSPCMACCSFVLQHPATFYPMCSKWKNWNFLPVRFFNLLPNYFGIAWMAMWEIVISKHKAYKT